MVPARAPSGTRVYAIGDIHGCARLLHKLHQAIRDDALRAPEPRKVCVYLGDYIDRGPDSREVVDGVMAGPAPGFECVHLMGNHEDFLLRHLRGEDDIRPWRANGGDATLRSYGIRPAQGGPAHAGPEHGGPAGLDDLLPPSHRAFYEDLRLTHVEGDYLFVHAGLRPGRPVDRQTAEDLLWIRAPFLDSTEDWGYTVVHGHSTVTEPEIRENRINLDTGAVWTGRLTAMVFHGDARDVLQT